ncbi:MAG: hypothetical protein LBE67_09205 [Kocuria palustris]|nr:hypothetical protein [Kocuria palustris]
MRAGCGGSRQRGSYWGCSGASSPASRPGQAPVESPRLARHDAVHVVPLFPQCHHLRRPHA